jgi:hypothetical protein
MPTHSNMNQSKQQASLPIDQRPQGNEGQRRDTTSNPPGERRDDRGQAQAQEQKQQQQKGPGQPSPGLKDRDAETSNSYGDTRDSGEGQGR